MKAGRSVDELMASGRYSGRLGQMLLVGPLMHLSVSSQGIAVNLPFKAKRVIRPADIRSVRWQGGWERGLRIAHESIDLPSPLSIRAGGHDKVARSILTLFGQRSVEGRDLDPRSAPAWTIASIVVAAVSVGTSFVFLSFGILEISRGDAIGVVALGVAAWTAWELLRSSL